MRKKEIFGRRRNRFACTLQGDKVGEEDETAGEGVHEDDDQDER